MGGIVAVTIRKEDDSLIKMSRFTGSYNDHLLFTKNFFNKQFNKAIDEYVAKMHPEREGLSNFSPDSYGQVFIDFKNKEIYSLQDYDAPGLMILGEILMTYKRSPNYAHLVELYKQNDLIHINSITGEHTPLQVLFNDKQCLIEANHVLINNENASSEKLDSVMLDSIITTTLEDWKMTYFSNMPQDYADFVRVIVSKGISLSNEEIETWKSFAVEATDYDEGMPDDLEPQDYVDNLFSKALKKSKNTRKM